MTAYAFYEERIGEYNAALTAVKKRSTFLALLRLLAFLASAVFVYLFFQQRSTGFLAVGCLFFFLFLWLINYSIRLRDRRALLEKLLFVCNNEIGVLKNEPGLMDDGSNFLNANGYAYDLDIFGKRSLFHLINRCTTSHGKASLSALLEQPLTDSASILQRQEAVRILSTQTDRRNQIIARGLLYGETAGNLQDIETWLQEASRLHRKRWLPLVLWILPVYNIPAFLYYLAAGDLSYFLFGFTAAWIFTAGFGKHILRQHLLVGKKHAILQQYAGILKTFAAIEPGSSALLHQLRQIALDAYGSVVKLAKISSFFDQRLNLLVNILLNSFILYDLRCLLALERWKARNKESFAVWLRTVGDIECLNSFAGFAFHNPEFCYPQLQEDRSVYVSASQIAHPLIPSEERVANDFEIGKHNRLMLITGSNMSGKTTFLRTLGVNLILAQNGAPVCAKDFSFSPMQILTAIRVNDSLQEHTSYFMAELKRLQNIIQILEDKRPALVLIDEILRGTNSEDKTHGSEQFILQLLHYNCIALFATHDLSLGKLEHAYPGTISNYCFESIIRDDSLHFDYKLHAGIARNKNASFLMRKMGIVREI